MYKKKINQREHDLFCQEQQKCVIVCLKIMNFKKKNDRNKIIGIKKNVVTFLACLFSDRKMLVERNGGCFLPCSFAGSNPQNIF